MLEKLKPKHAVVIAPESILLVLGILLGGYFLYSIRAIVALVLLSFILMVALRPVVLFLQNKVRLSPLVSIFTTYVVIIIVCILLAIVLLPPLISQGYGLIREVEVPGLDLHFENYSFTLTDISNIADRLSGSAATLFSIVNSTFSSILMFFTLIVLSMYMMLGRQKLYMKFYWITRNVDTIVTIRGLIDDIEEQLGGWVRGQLILMFVIGIANFIVLSLLGVPYALALALVAGALEILPNLGPTLAAVPSVVVAYVSGGPVLAIAVLVGVIIIQQVENNILVPKIMSDNANVNPLASIIIILIGLTLGGVVGALLCIPIYIIIRALYSTFVLSQHVQHDNLNVDKT